MDVDLEDIFSALATSVTGIVAAGGPNMETELQKSFSQCRDFISEGIEEELAKSAPDVEEPLYKGLGTVGRIANMLSRTADQIDLIKTGRDWKGQLDVNDPASEDLYPLLDAQLRVGEMLLRKAVNDHVSPADDDEIANGVDGMTLLAVGDPDDDGIIVKCDLPEDLAKFAMFPDELDSSMIEFGAELMVASGVPEQALAKFFDDGDLAKLYGDPNADPTTGAGDPNADPTLAGGDDGSTDDPFDVMGRLLAACMIQLEHVRAIAYGEVDGGTGDPTGDGSAADPNADPTAAAPAAADPTTQASPVGTGNADPDDKKKLAFLKKDAPGGDELQKLVDARLEEMTGQLAAARAENAELSKMAPVLQQVSQTLERLKSSTLEVPRGVLAAPLAKTADDGTEAELRAVEQEAAERLAKMAPEARAEELLKMTFRQGGTTPTGMALT